MGREWGLWGGGGFWTRSYSLSLVHVVGGRDEGSSWREGAARGWGWARMAPQFHRNESAELGASGKFVVVIKVNHSASFSVTFSDTLVFPGGGGDPGESWPRRQALSQSLGKQPCGQRAAPDATPPSAPRGENSESKQRCGTGFLDLRGRSLVGKPRGKNSRLQELGLGGSWGPLAWPDSCRRRNPWVRVLGSG